MKRRQRGLKAFAAALLALMLTGSLLGCQPAEPAASTEPPESAESAVKPTLPLPADQVPDDTLYTAVRKTDGLHPLYPMHESASALLRLVYEPLFDLGADGRIRGVIVRNLRWSPDQLTCTLTLDSDRVFHDGRSLRAEDVLASLMSYLTLNEISDHEGERGSEASSLTGLYRQKSLQNIESVSVGPSNTLIIRLSEPDPYLPALLTFPVVQAEDAFSGSAGGIPGTGPWKIASYGQDGSFTLVRLETGGQIKSIQALAFASGSEAAAALDMGEVDLVYMDADETIQFADRSRIRKQVFGNGGYISLYFNEGSRSLDERDAFLFRARQMSAYERMAAPLQSAFYPIAENDPRLSGTDLPIYQIKALPGDDRTEGEEVTDDSGRPEGSDLTAFKLLVPQELNHQRLIDQIGMVVRKNGRRLVVEEVASPEWKEAVGQGRYDALLLLEPGGFILDPADYLEGLRLVGLEDWQEVGTAEDRKILSDARRQVLAADGEKGSFSSAAYGLAIGRIFQNLPLAGLASTASMVWYSNDVEGTLTGTWSSPFEGVEDLLIWRR